MVFKDKYMLSVNFNIKCLESQGEHGITLRFQIKKLILLFLNVDYKSTFWEHPRNHKNPL